MKKRAFLEKIFFVLFVGIVMSLGFISAIEPFGVSNLTVINSTRAQSPEPFSVKAQAGNVTELNIYGYSITQSWQGYFGNITGTIQLADAANNVLYNWSLASPRGEVFASTANVINWRYLQCFNFSAVGNFSVEDLNYPGQMSRFGKNVTQLETEFNIRNDSVDGVDETFYILGSGGHREFYVANLHFSQGECYSTKTLSYDVDAFWEVLMYDPLGMSTIFASLINPDKRGFNNNFFDFQMLVLEDGHNDNTATTTYYFWVELE